MIRNTKKELTQVEKEYIVLAIHFFNEWKEDSNVKGTKFNDLIVELNRGLNSIFDSREVPSVLEAGYRKIIDIAKGNDFTANAIVLSIGFIFLLIEEDTFKGSKNMALKRISMDIYNECERHEQFADTFRLANKFISKYQEYSRGN